MIKKLIAVTILCFASMGVIVPVPGEIACTTSTCTLYDQSFYHIETGVPFNFSWGCNLQGCNGSDTEFVVETRRFPPVDTDVPVNAGVVPYNLFVWRTSLPKMGVYYQRIKACYIGKRDAANCSVWVNSYDPDANRTMAKRGWVLEVKLKSISL